MRKKKRAADKKKATEKEKNLKFEEVDWKGLMEAGLLVKKLQNFWISTFYITT